MSGKGSFNPFGGLFDFDGDGKTDLGEEFIAFQMFREIFKQDDEDIEVFEEEEE